MCLCTRKYTCVPKMTLYSVYVCLCMHKKVYVLSKVRSCDLCATAPVISAGDPQFSADSHGQVRTLKIKASFVFGISIVQQPEGKSHINRTQLCPRILCLCVYVVIATKEAGVGAHPPSASQRPPQGTRQGWW